MTECGKHVSIKSDHRIKVSKLIRVEGFTATRKSELVRCNGTANLLAVTVNTELD